MGVTGILLLVLTCAFVAPVLVGLLANKVNRLDAWLSRTTGRWPVFLAKPAAYYAKAAKSIFTVSIYVRAKGKPVTVATWVNAYIQLLRVEVTIFLATLFAAALLVIPAFISAVPLRELVPFPGVRLDPYWVYPSASIALLLLTDLNQAVKVRCAKTMRGAECHYILMCALAALALMDWTSIDYFAVGPLSVLNDASKDVIVGVLLATASTLVLDVSQAAWSAMLFYLHPLNITTLEDRSMSYERWHERGQYREGMVTFERVNADGDIALWGVVYVPRLLNRPEVVKNSVADALQQSGVGGLGVSVGLLEEHNYGLSRALMIGGRASPGEWHLSVRAAYDRILHEMPDEMLIALREHVPWGWASRSWNDAWVRLVIDALLFPFGLTLAELPEPRKDGRMRTYPLVLNDAILEVHVSRRHGLVAAYLIVDPPHPSNGWGISQVTRYLRVGYPPWGVR